MSKFIVSKSTSLHGTVTISGSKNSALPILAASLLSDDCCTIENIPDLLDIKNMEELLTCLGATINKEKSFIEISCKKPQGDVTSYETVNKLRASFLVMGPLLAKTGKIKISLPGGCQIGTRPVDLHLKGFVSMGAKVSQGHGYIEAKCQKLIGAQVYLDFPSVGATENIMMAAALAHGTTTIENAAIEPEIVDLANFINNMGGCVFGAGTDTITIEGVKNLSGTYHKVIPDRIEAGTFATAVAIAGGKVKIDNVIPDHLKPLTAKMRESGIIIIEGENHIIVDATSKAKAVDIKTLPYPGFPTDMQAPYTSLMSVSDGTSMIIETIFENRFMHMAELKRMGANIKVEGRTAVVEGTKKLTGAQVKATDLRAGAALVLAGLRAEGETEINDIEHIQRGYCNFDQKLNSIGANITFIQ